MWNKIILIKLTNMLIFEISDADYVSAAIMDEEDGRFYATGDGNGEPPIVPHLSPYRVPWTVQCKALLWRSWLTMIREPIIIKVRVLETIVSLH